MSGGRWDYVQHRIGDIADDLDALDLPSELGEGWGSRLSAHRRFAVKVLRQAEAAAQRWDWLLSGDDGPESFLRRFESDMDEIKKKCER